MSQQTRTRSLRWDIFKGVVAVILLILLILLLLRGCGTLGIAPVAPIPSEQATEPAATSPSTPTTAHAVPEILSPSDRSQITSTVITLSGTGDIGSTLQVKDGSAEIGSVVVGSDGHWSTEISASLGDHTYSVTDSVSGLSSPGIIVTILPPATGAAGLTPTPAPVTVQPTPASGEGQKCDYTGVVVKGYKPDKLHYVVGTCDTMSTIAASLGIRLSALIAANPQIKDPNIIFPGQVLNLP